MVAGMVPIMVVLIGHKHSWETVVVRGGRFFRSTRWTSVPYFLAHFLQGFHLRVNIFFLYPVP